MNKNEDAKKIINLLESSDYYADCPCCNEPMLLRDSNLFYLDDFSPEARVVYSKLLTEIGDRKKELHLQKKHIVKSSKSGAEAVNIGLLSERIAPSLKDFPFNRGNWRSLFDPIDYIVFDGLNKTGSVNKISFVEIKTGKARLQNNQKNIKFLVENKKVDFDTYKNKANQ